MISTDVLSFVKQNQVYLDHLYKGYNEAVTESTKKGWQMITRKTPVDTGRARASWEVGVNRRKYIRLPKTPRGTRAYSDPMLRNFKFDIRNHTAIYISNILPYVPYLEHGTQRIRPHGMVSTSTATIQRSLRYRLTRIK